MALQVMQQTAQMSACVFNGNWDGQYKNSVSKSHFCTDSLKQTLSADSSSQHTGNHWDCIIPLTHNLLDIYKIHCTVFLDISTHEIPLHIKTSPKDYTTYNQGAQTTMYILSTKG